jgi:hypothetical protein
MVAVTRLPYILHDEKRQKVATVAGRRSLTSFASRRKVAAMTLAAAMLDDDALRATADGFELDVHLGWYRSLPLSSLEQVELTVAGEPVAREEIRFALDGDDYALDALPERFEQIWFVLDAATLRVARPLVRRGEQAEVRVRLVNRIPYILVGPETALRFGQESTRTLVAR